MQYLYFVSAFLEGVAGYLHSALIFNSGLKFMSTYFLGAICGVLILKASEDKK